MLTEVFLHVPLQITITQSAEMPLQMAATHPPVKGVAYLNIKVRVFLICMHKSYWT